MEEDGEDRECGIREMYSNRIDGEIQGKNVR